MAFYLCAQLEHIIFLLPQQEIEQYLFSKLQPNQIHYLIKESVWHHFTVFSNRYYKQHIHGTDLDMIERNEIEIASCGGSHTPQELPPIPPELMALAQAETFTRHLYQAELNAYYLIYHLLCCLESTPFGLQMANMPFRLSLVRRDVGVSHMLHILHSCYLHRLCHADGKKDD